VGPVGVQGPHRPVIASTRAVVVAGGVLAEVSSGPPLTVRQVQDSDAGVCHLCLIGSAAGPLAGDEVTFELEVGEGARARLSASGASIAQGRRGGAASQLRCQVKVGAGAELIARPAPLIVAAGSAVHVSLELQLAESAYLQWRELLVLGRYSEPAGEVVLDWRVRRAGRPLLVQSIDLAGSPGRNWAGMLDGARVLATALVAGPRLAARTVVDSAHAVCQQVDSRAALVTVLERDAAAAEVAMDALLSQLLS
jgi:urease accessory protein